MAAGDKYVDCNAKNLSAEQLLRKLIYVDVNGNPALHTDPAGTALQPYFNCDRENVSFEQVLRDMILEDADGKPYLNTTS